MGILKNKHLIGLEHISAADIQKLIDTGGRLEKFEKRFGKKIEVKEEEKVTEIEQSPVQETKATEKVLTTSKKATTKKKDSLSKKSKTKTSKKEKLE